MRTVNALVNSIQRRIRATTAARGGGGVGVGGGTPDVDFQFDFDFKIWGVATNELNNSRLVDHKPMKLGTFVSYMYRFVIIVKYLTNFFKLEWNLGIKFTLRFFFLSVYEKYQNFYLKIFFFFLVVKISINLNRRVFVMPSVARTTFVFKNKIPCSRRCSNHWRSTVLYRGAYDLQNRLKTSYISFHRQNYDLQFLVNYKTHYDGRFPRRSIDRINDCLFSVIRKM